MRKALGRGLEALIPGAGAASSPRMVGTRQANNGVVAIDLIRPNPRQPRGGFDDAALAELATSIRAKGVIQPVVVRPRGDGEYELVAGERRLRAAQQAGLREVPVVVREVSDSESLELALIENLQRDDLSPLEAAAAYQRLMDEFGHTQEEVATRVGKSRPTIANTLRLLRLPEAIKSALKGGRLTAGHARVLVSIDDPQTQLRAARQIVAREMSVRESERLAAGRRPTGRRGGGDPHRSALERELGAALGTRVRIRPRKKGGCIEIEYYSPEELQSLVDRMCGRSRNFDNPSV